MISGSVSMIMLVVFILRGAGGSINWYRFARM